jgi:HSP20 family protein
MARNQLTRGNGLGSHPLALFRQQMDSLFDNFFRGWPSVFSDEDVGGQRFWDFDVRDEGNEMVVRAETPGFDENELNVELHNDVLTIRAEKKQEGEQRQEYRSYYRSVTLPSGTDAAKVQATYRNGVLELRIPKPEGAQAKRIPIRGQQGGTAQPALADKSKGNGHGARAAEPEAAAAGPRSKK